jgi:mannose-6-phosphate isomerase-like protein (cupin superfamily)
MSTREVMNLLARQRDQGESFWILGDLYTFKLSSEESIGSLAVIEHTALSGNGPPPHIHHREDESFYILDGTFSMLVGDQTFDATAGAFVHIPKGTLHTLRKIGAKPGKVLVILTPEDSRICFGRSANRPGGARSRHRLRKGSSRSSWRSRRNIISRFHPHATFKCRRSLHYAAVGKLFSGGPFEALFWNGETLGGTEGAAAFDACPGRSPFAPRQPSNAIQRTGIVSVLATIRSKSPAYFSGSPTMRGGAELTVGRRLLSPCHNQRRTENQFVELNLGGRGNPSRRVLE